MPAPRRAIYPTLLDQPAPEVLAYPREVVVAEKLEAMVTLGVTNSHMKDFYDVQFLSASFAFDGPPLADAIRATFERRRTPLPESVPLALTTGFLAAPERQAQWRAFLRRGRLAAAPIDAEHLAEALRAFLWPPLEACARHESFSAAWSPARGERTIERSAFGSADLFVTSFRVEETDF